MFCKQLEYQKMKRYIFEFDRTITFSVRKWAIKVWIFSFIMALNKSF